MNGTVEVAGLACSSCHGDSTRADTALNPQFSAAPPKGTKGETATSARAVGAHALHLKDGNFLACTECHVLPTSTGHSNGTVEISFGPLARTGGASPSWNGTTCSNVYCHGSFTGGKVYAPNWTAPVTSTCGTCHGLPPVAPHPQNADCSACHTGYTATSVNPSLHLNGKLDVSALGCTACHGDSTRTATTLNPNLPAAPPRDTGGNSAATFPGVGAHQAHLNAGPLRGAMACTECHTAPPQGTHPNGTVDLAWGALASSGGATPSFDAANHTCTNYCHGATLGGATHSTPSWIGGLAEVTCGSCHGLPPPSPHPGITITTSCGDCHTGFTRTTVNTAVHANGVVDLATITCASCHGDATRAGTALNPLLPSAPPKDTTGNTATTARGVGAHQRHLVAGALTAGIACSECHAVPTSNAHSNGTVDVQFGTLAKTGAVSPTWNGSGCSASYCHGNFKNGNLSYVPNWTAPAATVCGTCHGSPGSPAPGGTHPVVTATTSCASCHPGYTATTVNPTTHANGVVDVSTMTCTSCHGNSAQTATQAAPLYAAPPVDTKGNSAATTRGVGAHQAHLFGTTLRTTAIACGECHTIPAATSHSNGTVDMTWGTLARAGASTPTWTGTTCTNYCHGATLVGGTLKSPTWTGGAAQVAGCAACHGAPPAAPHVQNTACGSCHTGFTSTTVAKATHIDGTVNVATLTCSTCHGLATRTATTLNPQLAAAPPSDTSGNSATSARGVGAHIAHLTGTTLRTAALACTECHAVPTAQTHANGTVDMIWGPLSRSGGATPAWSGTTCTNYCHGANLTGGTITAPTWIGGATQVAGCTACHGAPPPAPHSTSTACGSCHTGYTATSVDKATHMNGTVDITGISCTSCHGSASRAATATNPQLPASPPIGTKGETLTTTRAVGAHQAHLVNTRLRSAAITCNECHVVPTSTSHFTGVVNMTWGTLSRSGGATPTWTGTTCTNYCHGSTLAGGLAKAPTWTGDATLAACNSCHGAPPAAPHSTSTACASCHGTGYSTTTVNAATHMNGTVDVPSMNCTSCHGTATRTATTLNPQIAAAPPVGVLGETATTTRAVGAHMVHLTGGSLRGAMACTECHTLPTVNTHTSGTVELAWGTLARTGGATPSWNGTALTCANYCHGATLTGGTLTAPKWTNGSADTTCGSCHGSPPPAPHPSITAGTSCGNCHPGFTATTVNVSTHVNGIVDVIAMTCTSCHGTSTRAATALNPQLPASPPVGTKGETLTTTRAVGAHQAHLVNTRLRSAAIACSECHVVPTSTSHSSGVVNLAWGTLTRTGGVVPTWTGTTCTNYCHGATLFGGTATAPTWTGTATQAACTSCHGAPPPAPHSTSTACASCHGTGYSTTTVNAATHMNGTVDVIAMTCTSCHGTSTRAATALNPQLPAAPPVDTAGNTATTARGVGAHMKHLSTATRSSNFACTECHTVPTSTSHSNGSKNVTFGALARTGGVTPAYNATSTGCSATYCHGNFTGGATTAAPLWTGGTLACNACHSMPNTSTGRHSTHGGSSFNCSDCHSGIATGTSASNAAIVGPALHVNGVKNVVIAPANAITYTAGTRTCSGTCHSKSHNYTW
jgi:predicted CxxxxCH...CXXCH cytochrome family protein